MSPTAAERLAEARRKLTTARRDVLQTRAAVLAGDASRRQLAREHSRDDHELIEASNEQQTLRNALRAAALREQQARTSVHAALGEFLASDSGTDVGTLSAAFPIVLLPVRLETRFAKDDSGGDVLKVRVYPDELMADNHEPPLTATERAAGERFWRDGWAIEQEREAWRALVAEFPATRAAWIAKSLTPTNVASRPTTPPVFPDTEVRPESWTRAAEARVLPDRWMAIAYRNGAEVRRELGSPIEDPLVLSIAPLTDDEMEASTVEISGDGLRLDAEVVWTVDFNRAVEVGMALTMPLEASLAEGIDRLIVVGVKSSVSPEAAVEQLAGLFEAHHYDTGLAFVRQGTPTNNTTEAPSPFPGVDADGALSFVVERGNPITAEDGNGTLFTRAFGLPEAVTAHVAQSDLREQPAARAMNEALWPATWRYFLGQLMDPVVTDEAVRAGRAHFIRYVRGRGPLPAFRVGGTPYGVLPVTSLSRWTTADAEGVEVHLPPLLRNLSRIWTEQVRNVPRVNATADPDADLLGVLGMDASAREVRARPMLGPQLQSSLFSAMNISQTHWQSALQAIAQDVLAAIGHADWNPRLAAMTFADGAHRVGVPFVAPAPLSETAPLQPFNYINWIRTASLDDLREEVFPPGAGHPTALLYYLLRHAALGLYAEVGTRVAIKHNVANLADLRESEVPGVGAGGATRPTVWDRLKRPIPNVTGQVPLGRFLLSDTSGADTREIRAFRSALEQLEHLPTAELDRLLTETLDTCSHRLDAWITSLASKRLDQLRQQQPSGCHLGAFGWVEDLHPDTHHEVEPPELGGFIQAPSASHAATAAILRNAYAAHSGQGADRYAIDLSSTRVRQALHLLDGVRQGQPLGAVLGYRFERGLHEGHRPLRLEKYIDPFRRLFPLVADKAGESGEPAESIAARNVVDGLLLRTAAQAGTIPWGQHSLPLSGNDRLAIEAELLSLDRAVDAVADLLTTESVFQIVRGNTDKAASVLDALGQGLRPPEPEVVLQPRAGTTASHRVAIVLGGGAFASDGWSGVADSPRSLAEPALDRWVGWLFGDPSTVRCRVRQMDGTSPDVRVVTLLELGLRPVDVLELTKTLDADAGSELDARVLSLVPDLATQGQILYAADPSWDRSTIRTFPDVLELARAINALLATSRALGPEDLLPSDEVQSADAADRLPAEAAQRAGNAEAALNALMTQLDAALHASPLNAVAVQGALRAASLFGVRGAFDGSRHSGDALSERGAIVAGELARRSAAASAGADSVEKVRAVFGRDFMFLPRFHPVNASELNLAVGHGPALVGDGNRVAMWMQQLSRVRPHLWNWRQVTLLAGVLGHPGLPMTVAQLPHAPDGRWVGLSFSGEAERPPSGQLSLALHRPVSSSAGDPWVGLLVDDWTEIIPRPAEDTAIAFHYDDPGAEAAQVVLIAVPATQAPNWNLETLLDTVNETLDLAKVRGVDAELLPLGQLLPAIYLAANPRKDTVSTDLRAVLQRSDATG